MTMDMKQIEMPTKSVQEYDTAAKPVKPEKIEKPDSASSKVNVSTSKEKNSSEKEQDKALFGEKEPSKKTIDSAISNINSKLKMQRTRCEYEYDEDVRRVSIKIYNQDTDELVLEVPPEESLKAIKKAWELAGIMVDKKM